MTSSQVAIVTGGNSGMGMAIVRSLVKSGWKIAIADIQENKDFAEELGENSIFCKCEYTLGQSYPWWFRVLTYPGNVADYDRIWFG